MSSLDPHTEDERPGHKKCVSFMKAFFCSKKEQAFLMLQLNMLALNFCRFLITTQYLLNTMILGGGFAFQTKLLEAVSKATLQFHARFFPGLPALSQSE